jgi:hypothetical protein
MISSITLTAVLIFFWRVRPRMQFTVRVMIQIIAFDTRCIHLHAVGWIFKCLDIIS